MLTTNSLNTMRNSKKVCKGDQATLLTDLEKGLRKTDIVDYKMYEHFKQFI